MRQLSVALAWFLATVAACGDDTSPTGGSDPGGAPASGGGVSAGGNGEGGTADVCDAVDPGLDPEPLAALWSELTPLPGGPRQETAVVAVDESVYVMGGFTLTDIVDVIEVYDTAQGTWSEAAPLPEPLHHANAAVADGRIYVLGYLATGTFEARGDSHVYDPASDEWTEIASMPSGTERGAAAVGVVGNRIVVAGGFRGGVAVSDVSAYDPASDSWQALPDLPVSRDHGGGAVVDGAFYVFGGREGVIESQSDAVFAFDEAADAWCERAPMPTARGGVAASVVDGLVFVVGGEGNTDDPNGVFTNVEVYDASNNRWSIATPLPIGRHGTGAATVGATLFLPGGADHQAFGAVADVSSCTLANP